MYYWPQWRCRHKHRSDRDNCILQKWRDGSEGNTYNLRKKKTKGLTFASSFFISFKWAFSSYLVGMLVVCWATVATLNPTCPFLTHAFSVPACLIVRTTHPICVTIAMTVSLHLHLSHHVMLLHESNKYFVQVNFKQNNHSQKWKWNC